MRERERQKARQYLNGHAPYKRGGPGLAEYYGGGLNLKNFSPKCGGGYFRSSEVH